MDRDLDVGASSRMSSSIADVKSLSRGSLDVFCSCPMVRPAA
jgi:hypothetical protein